MNIIRAVDTSVSEEESALSPVEPEQGPVLSIADAARALKLTPSTVRRYIAEHEDQIDVVRNGRRTMVLLSSFPTLARIRDLRRRKLERGEIDDRLKSRGAEEHVADSANRQIGVAADGIAHDVAGALDDLRKEVATLKQELRDNELIVRQSLSTILFLIEKYAKELEFHASEERIANRERDLRLSQGQAPSAVARRVRSGRRGIIAALTSLFLTPSSSR